MAKKELILSFEGPKDFVRPDRCDVRPLLLVQLRFVELLERISKDLVAVDDGDASFSVVMKELRAGSIKSVYAFVPTRPEISMATATSAGHEATSLVPQYLESRNSGTPGVRKCTEKLAKAIREVPAKVQVHLRGLIDASLSELALSDPTPAAVSVETFRATILKAGGVPSRIQLRAKGSERPFTLDAPMALATLAGQTLYEKADVTADIQRTADGRVLHGNVRGLRILEKGDPVAAFDRWYARSGKPWSKVKDIEEELNRGRN
jgi:hypothetical protein